MWNDVVKDLSWSFNEGAIDEATDELPAEPAEELAGRELGRAMRHVAVVLFFAPR